MKNLFIILFVFISQIAFSNVDTLKVESKITEVTVFLQGAQVTRSAKLNLIKGKFLLLFERLPYELNPESIQVEGMNDCKILSVKHKYTNPYRKSDSEIEIQAKIDSEELKLQTIQNEIKVFDIEEQLLMDNRILSKKGEGSSIKEIKEAADFYRQRFNEIKKEKLKLETIILKLRQGIKKLYSQLNKFAVEGKKSYTQIQILIECEKQNMSMLRLKYYVFSSGWTPSYDYRVEDISKPLVLVYNAKVFQSTGEKWNNVKLKLATSNPAINNNKPELMPWYIERGFPDYKSFNNNTTGMISGSIFDSESNENLLFALIKLYKDGKLIKSTQSDIDGNYIIKSIIPGTYKLVASYIGYKEEVKQNIRVLQGKIVYIDFGLKNGNVHLDNIVVTGMRGRTAGMSSKRKAKREKIKRKTKYFIPTTMNKVITNLEYEINISYSIPSDGMDYNIKMKEISIPVEYIYQVVPKLKNDAFLIAKIPDWTELNLLSGKSNIYYQGTFVGESFIDANQTKDTLNISLGKDSNIIVERKVNKRTKAKKFFSTKIKETIEWDIVIKNKKDTNIKIIIKDQVPISENKAINIELLESSNSEIDKKTGTLVWLLDLKPDEKKTTSFKYSVKYPRSIYLRTEF